MDQNQLSGQKQQKLVVSAKIDQNQFFGQVGEKQRFRSISSKTSIRARSCGSRSLPCVRPALALRGIVWATGPLGEEPNPLYSPPMIIVQDNKVGPPTDLDPRALLVVLMVAGTLLVALLVKGTALVVLTVAGVLLVELMVARSCLAAVVLVLVLVSLG